MENSAIIGNPEDLFNAPVSALVSRRSLPEVVGFLVNKRGPKQAEQDLRDIAKIIVDRMFLVWTPKSLKPFKVFKEMMKLFFGNKKIKGKILERVNGRPIKIAMRDHDCPICPEKKKEFLEVSELHYCVAVSGFIESVIRNLMDRDLVPYTYVSCKTVKSTGSGDKYCEHIIELEYGGY